MSPNLRALPSLRGVIDEIAGGRQRDDALAEILEQFWPDCYQSEYSNKVIIAPADAARLEALFELFGVPLKVQDNGLSTLAHAYDVFSIGLAPAVSSQLRFPDKFELLHPLWPPDWGQYIKAVGGRDHVTARLFAHRLQVLSPDCDFPPGVYVPASPTPADTG